MVCFTFAAWGPQRASGCVVAYLSLECSSFMELESSQDPGKGQKCPFSNQNRWHKVPENTLDPLLEHNFGHNLILDNNPNFFFYLYFMGSTFRTR